MVKSFKLYDLVDISRPESVLAETLALILVVVPDYKADLFVETFSQVAKLFRGDYPGYRASNTRYHDFEHTCAVVLASMRLMYGAHKQGTKFTAANLDILLYSSLFHDLGLIQKSDDTDGTGAKYTVGHEERSISFLKEHFCDDQLPCEVMDGCESAIRCTMLAIDPRKVEYADEKQRILGQILGTSDLLAQMADRFYLEKLLLLFEEFQEACLPGYDTAMDLLTKTRDFYEKVAIQRFEEGLGGVNEFMGTYFKQRWNLDIDLYAEAVDKNIEYLDNVLNECGGELECSLNYFRRGGIHPQNDDC